jgi:tetratricopeptide (TPR) repeat protein
LAAIESEFNAGAPIDIGRLEEIREPVIYCARQSKDCHPIPRLARLYALAKQKSSARELLVIARALSPANQQVLLMLANLHAEDRQYSEALQALEPVLDVLPQSAAILGRAADLTAKLGDIDRSLALHRRAAAADPARRKWYLNALIAANWKDEAL